MNFCSVCGQPVALKVPEGDQLPRYVCVSCGTIHYENPRIIAGCVIDVGGKILVGFDQTQLDTALEALGG